MSLLLLTEVLISLICVCGIIANGLLVYVISYCVSGRARALLTSRSLLQMAIADMFLCICLPALACSLEPRALPRRFSSASACDLLIYLLLCAQFAKSLLLSFFSLSAMGAWRGHVLDLRSGKVSAGIAVCWGLAAGGAGLLMLANGRGSNLCDPYSPISEYFMYREAFTLVYAIVCVLLPSTLFTLCIRLQLRERALDEQQIAVRESLRLATQFLGLHVICVIPHLLCQMWFTFEPQYERPDGLLRVLRVHEGSVRIASSDALTSRLYAHWISLWFLFTPLVLGPLVLYRLGRQFGYGPADLLEAMAASAADLQIFWRQQQQKLAEAQYAPIALYDKLKSNVKQAVKV